MLCKSSNRWSLRCGYDGSLNTADALLLKMNADDEKQLAKDEGIQDEDVIERWGTRAQSHARGIAGCGEMRRFDWMAVAPLWINKSALSCYPRPCLCTKITRNAIISDAQRCTCIRFKIHRRYESTCTCHFGPQVLRCPSAS